MTMTISMMIRLSIRYLLFSSTVVVVLGFTPSERIPLMGGGPLQYIPTTSSSSSSSSSPSSLYFLRDKPTDPVVTDPISIPKRSKPKIATISSLYELQYLLEEDDRPVAIKFYAPWCKTCQRVGRSFEQMAQEWGDSIQDRHRILGDIRFAQVEYNPQSASFITQTLKIPGVPTLQVYVGMKKLWEERGSKSIRGLKDTIHSIHGLRIDELQSRAEEMDDGVLQEATEDSFFQPDFLNEEW